MSRPQTRAQAYWDARAALNFMLGGAGAGLAIAAALAGSTPALALAMGMIAAGLFAVWLEIGRKLRALHVLFNPFTSWMTREAFAAALFFPLALGALFVPQALPAAALAAAAFLYCQARILHAARGIPAWRAPELVPLIVATGLAEGAGLALFFSLAPWPLFAAALAGRLLARWLYGRTLDAGALAALGLLAAAWAFPPAALAAAVAALGTGWDFKFKLITRASHQQASLPQMPVRGTR